MPKRLPSSPEHSSSPSPSDRPRSGVAARVVIALLRAYRLTLAPALPPSCRFAPSCSAFAIEAIGTHGVLRGGWLAARRLGRCHPWSLGGHDPVPAGGE